MNITSRISNGKSIFFKAMRCRFKKSNGNRCGANAMQEGNLCFTHNPVMKEAKKAATSKGGSASRRNHRPVGAIEINTNKDVVVLLAQTINEVRQGTIEVRVANCIFYGSGQLIKAFEVADLEERVVHLEERAAKDREKRSFGRHSL